MSAFKALRLTALDTLFFRESRPFDAIGGSELASVFPPPPRTVLGALRSAIGDALGADWRQFQSDTKYAPNGERLRDLIGYSDDLGKLSLGGIWLSLDGERLYPAPLFMLHRKEKDEAHFGRLHIGAAVLTNVGNVRLPEAPDRKHGYKPFEGTWLTCTGLEKVLRGDTPSNDDLRKQKDLFAKEPRLGIARDNRTRTAQDNLLYQSCHVRPRVGLSIEVDINVTDMDMDMYIENRIVRLGAEGRMADISIELEMKMPAKPQVVEGDTQGLILVLLTPARFENNLGNWLPQSFVVNTLNGAVVWKGTINGIHLTLHAAALGKAQREGGWDMAQKKPRDVQSLIPPGSSYYCTVDNGNTDAAIHALHGKQIGEDQKFGRGVIVCGLWRNEYFGEKA
ncbi:type III-B CRISPR module-associated protein Cmr3 [Candidatus Nitrotoga sp. M5]|uniref:type III-B CRISPR module-associated protein Cmr3 n=1 Tax=Candidatus Nitrotoga sp. M5 TaxID=2890409 RepID=UPI001EF5560A|nr:type III-B CRISPR module-associated protein Cmr3 [Candidatus Nitrotoga sp. M5]CAH1388339.1 Type III-B CRISPR module-associated protein Cmr3 [Candidatus Nitrotoga sp. M5]